MEELQKQLVRIFGDTVTFAGGEGPGGGSPLYGNSPESCKEDEVDILQQMRDKPATPLLR
jgi:hypothetical protein